MKDSVAARNNGEAIFSIGTDLLCTILVSCGDVQICFWFLRYVWPNVGHH